MGNNMADSGLEKKYYVDVKWAIIGPSNFTAISLVASATVIVSEQARLAIWSEIKKTKWYIHGEYNE